MKLYGNPMSTCTRKVLCVLAEKNATPEMVTIDMGKGEHKQADFMAKQPFGKIPVLDDDGFVLYESRAIIRYLDEKLGGEKLTPSDAKQHAAMEQWISIEMSYFTAPAMKIIYNTTFAKFRGFEPDQAAIEEGKKALEQCLPVMERQLSKNEYIAGNTFTLADVGYMPYLQYLYDGGSQGVVEAFPKVAAWWKKISSRPSWKKVTGN